MRVIDLSNNAVGPNGSQALSGYLKNATGLRVFHINNCGLGIQGATTIAEALKEGKVDLEVISMGRNRLEDKGATAIASALAEMKSIREVHLFQNVIREGGMVPLLEALAGKPELHTLDISDNFINEKSIDAFCSFLEKTPSLKNLNISDCNMELDLAKRVVDALEVRKFHYLWCLIKFFFFRNHQLNWRNSDSIIMTSQRLSMRRNCLTFSSRRTQD